MLTGREQQNVDTHWDVVPKQNLVLCEYITSFPTLKLEEYRYFLFEKLVVSLYNSAYFINYKFDKYYNFMCITPLYLYMQINVHVPVLSTLVVKL